MQKTQNIHLTYQKHKTNNSISNWEQSDLFKTKSKKTKTDFLQKSIYQLRMRMENF